MLDFSGIPLGSTYKRYKLGTTKLTDWLCETARRSGEVLRQKEVKTADLLRLAKAISDARPKVTVPITILLCAKDVIQGRTLCANFYTQLEDAGTKSGKTFVRMNKSHQYFISVLEEVQAILKCLEIDSAGKSSARRPRSKASSGKKSTFDVLELEEPSDAQDGSSVKAKHGKGAPDEDNLDEEAELEASFAIFCAFQDMRDIRLHLQAVWKKYYNGEVSYLVATQITIAGFSMVRDTNDGLFTACPWIETYDDISDYLGLECCDSAGESTFFMNNLAKVLPTGRGGPMRAGDTVKPEELFCALASNVLNDFRIYCRGTREPNNPNFQVRLSSHPLASMLRQVEPTIRFMADQVSMEDYDVASVHGFLLDHFTGSLITISKLAAYPVWAVVECQILIDILDALGNQPQVGFDILQDTLARGSNSTRVEKYTRLHEEVPAHLKSPTFDTTGTIPTALKAFLAKDKSGKKDKYGRLDGRPPQLTGTFNWPSDRHPEQLLSALPMLSGSRLGHLAFGQCIYYLQQANQDICVLGAAYAYRAAQAFGIIRAPWRDMDSVIDGQTTHGASYVLEASNLEGYARNFDTAIGAIPVTSSARRPKVPNAATIASRMKKLMPVSSYILAAQEAEITTDDSGREQFYRSLYLTAQRVYNTDHHTSLTPLELLNALQKSLVDDEVQFKFNYDGFSTRCQALMNTSRFSEADRQTFLENAQAFLASGGQNAGDVLRPMGNIEVAELVHTALWEAADLEANGAPWRVKAGSKLAWIASTMQGVINVDTDSWLSIARHGSSGHIPDSDAPRRRWEWGGKPKVVFGPETPQQAAKRDEDEKINNILNAACAKFREWNSDGLYRAENIAKVKPWTEKKIAEAGLLHLEVGEVKVIPEFEKITIPVRPKLGKGKTGSLMTWLSSFVGGGQAEDEIPDLVPYDD